VTQNQLKITRLVLHSITLVAIVFASACSSKFHFSSQTQQDLISDNILNYYHWLQISTAEDLDAEFVRLMDIDPNARSTFASLKLALVLSASSLATNQTEIQAQEILQNLMAIEKNRENIEVITFAELWLAKLNVDQRLKSVATQNKLLQEQLDALTSIEQELLQKEEHLVDENGSLKVDE
jgi:hypothetical protein